MTFSRHRICIISNFLKDEKMSMTSLRYATIPLSLAMKFSLTWFTTS